MELAERGVKVSICTVLIFTVYQGRSQRVIAKRLAIVTKHKQVHIICTVLIFTVYQGKSQRVTAKRLAIVGLCRSQST